MWPMLTDVTKNECRGILRRLELEAYAGLVTAFRAQGGLGEKKQELLTEIRGALHIGHDRHKAEMRRVVNDETLCSVAEHISKLDTQDKWSKEGRRDIPLIYRGAPYTAYKAVADCAVKEVHRINAKLKEPMETSRGNIEETLADLKVHPNVAMTDMIIEDVKSELKGRGKKRGRRKSLTEDSFKSVPPARRGSQSHTNTKIKQLYHTQNRLSVTQGKNPSLQQNQPKQLHPPSPQHFVNNPTKIKTNRNYSIPLQTRLPLSSPEPFTNSLNYKSRGKSQMPKLAHSTARTVAPIMSQPVVSHPMHSYGSTAGPIDQNIEQNEQTVKENHSELQAYLQTLPTRTQLPNISHEEKAIKTNQLPNAKAYVAEFVKPSMLEDNLNVKNNLLPSNNIETKASTLSQHASSLRINPVKVHMQHSHLINKPQYINTSQKPGASHNNSYVNSTLVDCGYKKKMVQLKDAKQKGKNVVIVSNAQEIVTSLDPKLINTNAITPRLDSSTYLNSKGIHPNIPHDIKYDNAIKIGPADTAVNPVVSANETPLSNSCLTKVSSSKIVSVQADVPSKTDVPNHAITNRMLIKPPSSIPTVSSQISKNIKLISLPPGSKFVSKSNTVISPTVQTGLPISGNPALSLVQTKPATIPANTLQKVQFNALQQGKILSNHVGTKSNFILVQKGIKNKTSVMLSKDGNEIPAKIIIAPKNLSSKFVHKNTIEQRVVPLEDSSPQTKPGNVIVLGVTNNQPNKHSMLAEMLQNNTVTINNSPVHVKSKYTSLKNGQTLITEDTPVDIAPMFTEVRTENIALNANQNEENHHTRNVVGNAPVAKSNQTFSFANNVKQNDTKNTMFKIYNKPKVPLTKSKPSVVVQNVQIIKPTNPVVSEDVKYSTDWEMELDNANVNKVKIVDLKPTGLNVLNSNLKSTIDTRNQINSTMEKSEDSKQDGHCLAVVDNPVSISQPAHHSDSTPPIFSLQKDSSGSQDANAIRKCKNLQTIKINNKSEDDSTICSTAMLEQILSGDEPITKSSRNDIYSTALASADINLESYQYCDDYQTLEVCETDANEYELSISLDKNDVSMCDGAYEMDMDINNVTDDKILNSQSSRDQIVTDKPVRFESVIQDDSQPYAFDMQILNETKMSEEERIEDTYSDILHDGEVTNIYTIDSIETTELSSITKY